MITKITRGDDLGGLVRYLAGPGRSNEHTSPQVVAVSEGIDVAHGVELSDAERLALTDQLDLPAQTFGAEVKGGYVWHLSLTIPAGDGQLTNEQWAEAAREVAAEMGFAGDRSPAPWVAMRHGESDAGNDHVHMAVSLIREGGTKASNWQDRVKMSKVAARLEKRFGVTIVEGRTAGAVPGATRAELEQTDRNERPETDRARLGRTVRGSALASKDEAEFVRRLRGRGVAVRPRFDKGDKAKVVGYSVAVAGRDETVWFGGGKLAKDLRLPALRAGWNDVEDQRAAWSRPSDAGAGPQTVVGRPAGVTRAELKQLDRDGDTSHDQSRLAAGVRTAVAASKNEGQFVRTLKGDPKMTVRPRHAEGRSGEVVGYEVAMLGRDRTLWFSDDRLGEDLRLPALRARWQPIEHQSLAWMMTRADARRPKAVEARSRETRVLKTETWQTASKSLHEMTDRLAQIAPDDQQGWATAARAASGMYAELSQRLEGDIPGPLGQAADTLARSAQKADHRDRRPDLAGMADVAAQASTKGGAGTAGWVMLAGELRRLSQALSELHQARGEAQRATAMLEQARASQAKQPKATRTDPNHQAHQAHQAQQQQGTGFER